MFNKCPEIRKAQTVIDNSRSESIISITSIVAVVAVAIIDVLGEICQSVGHPVFVVLCTDDGELFDATAT